MAISLTCFSIGLISRPNVSRLSPWALPWVAAKSLLGSLLIEVMTRPSLDTTVSERNVVEVGTVSGSFWCNGSASSNCVPWTSSSMPR